MRHVHHAYNAPPREAAADLARRLARIAEVVCRHYLSNGCRSGHYWHVGDVANTAGRSLYVRLSGDRAGKWTDAATGEHGDLLDLVALARDLSTIKDAMAEARRFLALPPEPPVRPPPPRPRNAVGAARRLFSTGQPIAGTLAANYLRHRGIAVDGQLTALRFCAGCFYRAATTAPLERLPAVLAAVTDLDGKLTGVHRTWLDPTGRCMANIASPRRAVGNLLGHGVRFGAAGDVLLAGEGIETVLSLKSVVPTLPMVAALSAAHLGALLLPPGLKRLYVARDADAAGRWAFERLAKRAHTAGIKVVPLDPVGGDFNDDLRAHGAAAMRAAVLDQM